MQYRFGDCVLDAARRELRRGAEHVAIEPQVFDVLEFLIRHRDRVVSHDDLIAGVWNGRIVSESTLASRINAARRVIGDDGAAQRLIRTIPRKGFRFIGEIGNGAEKEAADLPAPKRPVAQTISFCRTSDGVNIAVATAGHGPVLLKAANWLNHLEYDWLSPIWSPMFARLAERFRFVRYDGRGNGLSDRDVQDVSFAGFERDLDAVIASLGLKRFVLLGLSQGAAAAVSYAVRHPEHVSGLILYGGYAQGRNRRGSAEDLTKGQTVLAMMRQGWGQEDSAFMRAFSSLYLPNGSRELIRWFAEMQRIASSGDLAARLRVACDDIDITQMLPHLRVPTLVLHADKDNVVPLEQGRYLAANIAGARFTILDSENHVPIPGDPAWTRLLEEIQTFAAEVSEGERI